MKKILIFLSLILLVSLFVSPKNLLAVDTTSSATVTKINLVFPIAALGNCSSVIDCKAYCDNPVNLSACKSFGTSKDLYKQNPVAIAARTILGCDLANNSCKEVCSKKENYGKCKSFGEKYLKIASSSATPVIQNQASVCANFCASNPEACKPKNLPQGKYSQLESVCRSSGCSWGNFSCTCPKISTSTSTTSATPSSLINRILPAVQGASTGPNLFERIVMFLQGKSIN